MPSHALTFSLLSLDAASAVRIQTIDDILPSTPIESSSVFVRFLAFPINPQDILAIAGKYPVKPAHKTPDGSQIAGNDGVAIVERVGDAVVTFKKGDIVLPKRHGLGTWRTRAVFPAEELIRIPSSVDPVVGALLKMGFLPAYLLLEDIVRLHPGSWIVVNAALGVIPQMVCQFARLRGCYIIAVIRARADVRHAKDVLHENGADIIITEEDLETRGSDAVPALATLVRENKIVLALDAVFGHCAEQLARLLAPGGTFVNYGSLGGSDGVLQLTQELLFWKQITFRNFRLSKQLMLRSEAEMERLMAWFVELVTEGRLRTPNVEVLKWNIESEGEMAGMLHEALARAVQRNIGSKKTVIVF